MGKSKHSWKNETFGREQRLVKKKQQSRAMRFLNDDEEDDFGEEDEIDTRDQKFSDPTEEDSE